MNNWGANHGAISYGPVSYTHLDVYKRQSCVNVCPGKKNKETGEVEKALTMANMEANAGRCV